MSIMINYFSDLISTMFGGAKVLSELLFSDEAIYWFFYEGGWMTFLKGVLRGMHIARFGW